MKSSDLKVATHADIANIRYCVFCQPGGVPHTLAVRANWLNVHAGIMYIYGESVQTLFFDKAAGHVRKIWCLGTRLGNCLILDSRVLLDSTIHGLIHIKVAFFVRAQNDPHFIISSLAFL